MMNKFFCLFLSLLCFGSVQSQTGTKVFPFLNMPSSARSVALGTNFISGADQDISTAWNNPASLNALSHNQIFASYNNYVSDINNAYLTYARHFDKKGTFSAGLFYLDYGKFKGYDEAGISTGDFRVQDQCFHISYGAPFKEKFRYGASLKYIYSVYESYVSNGFAGDLSFMYQDTAEQLNMTVFARNFGFQAIPFNGTERKAFPFELAFAVSKRLAHLPLRYHLIFNNLQQPDMRYTVNETGQRDENGNPIVKKMTMGDNILRHISIGTEFHLSKHFSLRFGYDHRRRKEMTQDQKRGTAGFSWGLGFRIKKLHVSYGSGSYFTGNSINQFSLSMNLGELYRSK